LDKEQLINIVNKLESGLAEVNYKGYDPFDGLNSPIFGFINNRSIKLAWIQFVKKSPLNFRRFLNILKDHNPKGLALILSAYCYFYQLLKNDKYLEKAYYVAYLLKEKRTLDRHYHCWGYNFPWMARAFYVPRFKPNMIVSSFVGQAFLDLYCLDKNPEWLQLVSEIAFFIQQELILISSEYEICFGYIPGEHTIVHNSNLMGARLLARLYYILKDDKYKTLAIKSVSYTVNRQRSDGSWFYGDYPHHKWIDNFHTGFNLVAINDIQKFLKTDNWQHNIQIGFNYHLNNHFLPDMIPKYYNNKIYPIDIHNFAQGIITFTYFKHFDKAEKLIRKCLFEMWDINRQYFYYQKTRYYTNTINY